MLHPNLVQWNKSYEVCENFLSTTWHETLSTALPRF